MTLKELVSLIAKQEGKKHQAKVGDVREIIKLLSKQMAKDPAIVELLVKYGKKK